MALLILMCPRIKKIEDEKQGERMIREEKKILQLTKDKYILAICLCLHLIR
jgi:hypothetical protein